MPGSRAGHLLFALKKFATSGRGAAGGRVFDAVSRSRDAKTAREPQTYAHSLERQQHIKQLFAVTVLLHVGNLTTPTIRNACLRDLGRI